MNRQEAQRVVNEMIDSFRQRMSEAQIVVWLETLAPLPFDAGLRAVKELRLAQDFLPTHHEFLVAAQDLARRMAAGRALPAAPEPPPEACELCGGTGWRPVIVNDRELEAVDRCKCSKGRLVNRGLDEGYEHPKACNCHVCKLGVPEARRMRSGPADHPLRKVVDVPTARSPVEPDPLEMF